VVGNHVFRGAKLDPLSTNGSSSDTHPYRRFGRDNCHARRSIFNASYRGASLALVVSGEGGLVACRACRPLYLP
jgi:hypothetical protein